MIAIQSQTTRQKPIEFKKLPIGQNLSDSYQILIKYCDKYVTIVLYSKKTILMLFNLKYKFLSIKSNFKLFIHKNQILYK